MILGAEDFHFVLAAVLGVIHREVRIAQQFGDGLAMPGINGDADAGGDEQLIVFNLVRRAQGDQELPRRRAAASSSGWRVRTMMNSSPPMRPARSSSVSSRFKSLAYFPQQPVAHGMAEDVVDLFEAVEIDEQHGQVARALARVFQSGIEEFHEVGAVGQAGERVVPSLELQAFVETSLFERARR